MFIAFLSFVFISFVFSNSVYNPNEAEVVKILCQQISTYMKPKNRLNSVGIITPYQRQRKLIVDQLASWLVFDHMFVFWHNYIIVERERERENRIQQQL